MQIYLIRSIQVINEGEIKTADVLIKHGRIEKIAPRITAKDSNLIEINGEGKYLLPGAIDDQVHFREPGLTHKATIHTEAKAAVAGGVTSFMEMPNTVPPAFTLDLLEQKYQIARNTSLANYSFYIGTSNENADQRQAKWRNRAHVRHLVRRGGASRPHQYSLKPSFCACGLGMCTPVLHPGRMPYGTLSRMASTWLILPSGVIWKISWMPHVHGAVFRTVTVRPSLI